MEEKVKLVYESPQTMVFEVKQEGVICASGVGTNGDPTYNRFNDEEEW